MINIYDTNNDFIIECDDIANNIQNIKTDTDNLLKTYPDHKIIFDLSKTNFLDNACIGLFLYYKAYIINAPDTAKKILALTNYPSKRIITKERMKQTSKI